MSENKKGKTGQQNSKQEKPAQFSNQQKGSKPPQSQPTVYNVKKKSFVPVPVIHKTIIQNVVYVNAVPANSGVTIVQNHQKPANDKPQHNQKNDNNSHKPNNPAPKVPKQPNKATDVKQSKPYGQPGKRVVEQPKPYVQQPKPYVQQPKPYVQQPKPHVQQPKPHVQQPKPYVQQSKPNVQHAKTTVHKHIHDHEHIHTHQTAKSTQKPIVKTIVHKHVHVHDHKHNHSNVTKK